ncbi:MAG: hypothetical protein IKN53_02465 [Oscillibacter sp.]|nr:hypothetical protein [Oscillibacter sp.]
MPHDFRYISKHDERVKAAYEDLMLLLSEVHKELKAYYTFQHKVVGSYARNMITYDAKSNTGFDFDVNIYPHDDDEKYTAKEIKLRFKRVLDKHVKAHGFDFAEDSTRVLTIKVKDRRRARILYSVDFAFVNDYTDEDGNERQEYIRNNKKRGNYTWEEQSMGYYGLQDKIDWIKEQGLWESDLKPYYTKKKNANDDPDVHSRTLFAIAVHEICQKNGFE